MIEMSQDENVTSLTAKYQILILQIGTPTCTPCAAIKQRIDEWIREHAEVAARYVSLEKYPEMAADYGIFSVPAILVFVQGKLAIRENGYFSLDQILVKTERYIDLLSV